MIFIHLSGQGRDKGFKAFKDPIVVFRRANKFETFDLAAADVRDRRAGLHCIDVITEGRAAYSDSDEVLAN